jgi:hypothetical protein
MTDALRERGRATRFMMLSCRILLGGAFIAAAVTKIAAPLEFARAVYQYHLLPDWAINIVAVVLPWVELVAALAVLTMRSMRDAAAAILGVLLVTFAAAIGLNIYRGIEAPCGCFAALGNTPAGWWHLGGDLLLWLAASGIVLESLRNPLGPRSTQDARQARDSNMDAKDFQRQLST